MTNKTTQFVKRYATMINIRNGGRLTPETIALNKLVDVLEKRDRSRKPQRVKFCVVCEMQAAECICDTYPHIDSVPDQG